MTADKRYARVMSRRVPAQSLTAFVITRFAVQHSMRSYRPGIGVVQLLPTVAHRGRNSHIDLPEGFQGVGLRAGVGSDSLELT